MAIAQKLKDRVQVIVAKIQKVSQRDMINLGKAGYTCIGRTGEGFLPSRTRTTVKGTFICWSPLPRKNDLWRSSGWTQRDAEARLLAVRFGSKIPKENFHVQAFLFHFVFPCDMLTAYQPYKQIVLKDYDQVKNLLHEVQSLFPGRNYEETIGRHKAKHTLCLTPGNLSRNFKYEVSQASSKHNHRSPSSPALNDHMNFSPDFAKKLVLSQ